MPVSESCRPARVPRRSHLLGRCAFTARRRAVGAPRSFYGSPKVTRPGGTSPAPTGAMMLDREKLPCQEQNVPRGRCTEARFVPGLVVD